MKKRECYIVQDGDTLQKIAAEFLGCASHWGFLWAINQRHLRGRNADEIYPGEVIVLPPKCDELIKVKPFTPWPWFVESISIPGRDLPKAVIMAGPLRELVADFGSWHTSARNADITMNALLHYRASDRFPQR